MTTLFEDLKVEADEWTPRHYQVECIDAVFDQLEQFNSTLVVMATGTGKTYVFSHLIKRWNKTSRVLVLVHRDELLRQAYRHIKEICTDDIVEVECQGSRATRQRCGNASFWNTPRIVVASKDSLWRNLEGFANDEFGIVIVDEAHHHVRRNKTYQKIIDYFPAAKRVGFTATPNRTDERAMSQSFESVAYVYDILQAVTDGWLVPIVQQFVQVHGYDLSQVKEAKDGDFDEGELDRIMREERNLHGMVVPLMELANTGGQRRQVLGFAASVEHARMVAEIINRRQPNSAVWASSKNDDNDTRRSKVDAFKSGRMQYLINYNLFTEGFDAPGVRVIWNGRPTKSRLVYAQMIGRGTRPATEITGALNKAPDTVARKAIIRASAKPGVLVVDSVGNSGRHKLVTSLDILGGWFDKEVLARARKKAEARGGRGDVTRDIEEARMEVEQERQEKRKRLKIGVEYTTRIVDPFDKTDLSATPEPRWAQGRLPTDGQINMLRKLKYEEQDLEQMTFWNAKKAIDRFIDRRKKGLCSYGQAKVLGKYGLNVENLTFKDAGLLIDKIKKNGWKVEGLRL